MGIQFAFEDLLIGTTTASRLQRSDVEPAHFKRIPGLSVIQLWTIGSRENFHSVPPPPWDRPANVAPYGGLWLGLRRGNFL